VKYDASVVSELLARIRAAKLPSELAKGEMLMILNLRPGSEAALNTAVEDMEARFSSEERAKLLQIISDVLGGDFEKDQEAEAGDVTMQSVENSAGT
jgi:hypothetical protein